ncbi:MAG: hypothetical protein SAL70_04020 [Scytonema sp. PMC 1070.18]|nr:hypothetical protein [Scytonema sp. PMC 1070.18]
MASAKCDRFALNQLPRLAFFLPIRQKWQNKSRLLFWQRYC